MSQASSLLSFVRGLIAALVLGALHMLSFAGPGAHGPGGEHLDAPAASGAAVTSTPRFEAQTDLFELVGRLAGGELSLLIDRYDTNEPLLGARVEVESGGLKATAKFRADHGDYAIDDAALLKRLTTAGEHAIVITVRAGQDADLLNGSLMVGPSGVPSAGAGQGHGHVHDDEHAHDHQLERAWWIGAGLVLLAAGSMFVVWRQRRRAAWPAATDKEIA